MPYAQINLLIDILLIAALSFTLLPKFPKFVIALFALYFIPWIFPLPELQKKPDAVPTSATVPFSSPSSGQAPSYDLSPETQIFSPTQSPQETMSQTQDLYAKLIQTLGSATGTTPAPNSADVQTLNNLRIAGAGDRSSRASAAIGKLEITPDSAWFYLRIFWLSAAFLLWVQNAFVGYLALVPNLIPVFYLARGLPLAYETLQAQPWMQEASKAVTDEQSGQALLSQHGPIFAAVLIAMPTFLIVLLAWRQLRGTLHRGLKKFLQPDLYQVRLNGHLMDFNCEGKDLVIEGLRFQANRMIQDRKRPEVWTLGSGTVIEFVRRGPS